MAARDGAVGLGPTGRRKITVQELEAEVASPVATPPASLRQVRSAFKAGAHALGLPEAVVRFAFYLLGLTREVDWQGQDHDVPPIAWPSDEEIRFRFGIGRSRCTELKRALVDFGLARMRRSPNGKRYGKRCKETGRILYAWGFDLSPLAERTTEFERAAVELAARRAEGKQLRREISCLRNQVLALADLGIEQAGPESTEAEAGEWGTMAAQADTLWAERGDAWDPLALVPIAARLKALTLHARERAVAAAGVADEGVQSGPVGPLYRPHHRDTNPASISEEITTQGRVARPEADNGDDRDGQAPWRRPDMTAATKDGVSRGAPGQGREEAETALRGFPVTPALVLQIAPAFRDQVRSARPDWPELVQAAWEVRAALGISQQAWGEACEVLGRRTATVAVAAIAAKQARGQVASPGGYLRAYVAAHREGRLQLDRTLFGLADRLSGARPSRSRGESARVESDRARWR